MLGKSSGANKGDQTVFYVYVLRSYLNEERFYLGSTGDLRKRLESHNAGENRATQGSQWQLVYYEAYLTEQAARQREQNLKHHGKAKQSLMKRIKDTLKESRLGPPST